MYSTENSEQLEKFYWDVINLAVFNIEVSFLQFYPDIENYSQVIESQRVVKQICQSITKHSATKVNEVKAVLQNFAKEEPNLTENIATALLPTLVKRSEDIKRQILKMQVSQDCPFLVDNNWQIKRVISDSKKAFTKQDIKDKYVFNFSLFMNKATKSESSESIDLEMSKAHLKQFIGKLKELRKQMERC